MIKRNLTNYINRTIKDSSIVYHINSITQYKSHPYYLFSFGTSSGKLKININKLILKTLYNSAVSGNLILSEKCSLHK